MKVSDIGPILDRDAELRAEVDRLANIDNISRADDARLDRLLDELDELAPKVKVAKAIQRGAKPQSGDGATVRLRGIHDHDDDHRDPSAVEVLDRGLARVDELHRRGHFNDVSAERAERTITEGTPLEKSLAARWIDVGGSDAYFRAFAKLAAQDHGHLLWTNEEAEAFRNANAVLLEQRAMSHTDTSGGYGAPVIIDPAFIITGTGNINSFRAVADVSTTVSDVKKFVAMDQVSAEWKTEGAEMADASPTFSQPTATMFLGDAFVPYSYEIGMDYPDLLQQLSVLLGDAASNLMSAAYTSGNGTTAPQGIVTALAGSASEINGQGSEAIAATDPYDLQDALPARFSQNAAWMGHISTLNAYRQLETANGSWQFPELREVPPALLGRRWFEASDMDAAADINAAATANNYLLVYGDWSHFKIVDRAPSRIEFTPNLYGTTNGRPTGQRGAILWFRTGSVCAATNAFRMLDIPTTA